MATNYSVLWSVLLLLLASTWMGCRREALVRLFLKPARPFVATDAPAPPNYAKAESWHEPHRRFANHSVDVFFVHPTTYIAGKSWNQDLTDATTNWRTSVLSLDYQASAFYSTCNAFMPKYRQAIFASFVDKKGNGKQALELAYQDVRTAFEYYWTHHNKGRPFVLAGHSQGSRHLKQLLVELMADSSRRRQLVAAYTIGWPIEYTHLSKMGMDVCSTATQTGCLISWNAQKTNAKGSMAASLNRLDPMVCVNPLSWGVDTTYCSPQHNRGALMTNWRRKEPELLLHFCGAQVQGSVLEVPLASKGRRLITPIRKGNYHLYDYNLFYQNIKENLAQRIAAHANKSAVSSEVE